MSKNVTDEQIIICSHKFHLLLNTSINCWRTRLKIIQKFQWLYSNFPLALKLHTNCLLSTACNDTLLFYRSRVYVQNYEEFLIWCFLQIFRIADITVSRLIFDKTFNGLYTNSLFYHLSQTSSLRSYKC